MSIAYNLQQPFEARVKTEEDIEVIKTLQKGPGKRAEKPEPSAARVP